METTTEAVTPDIAPVTAKNLASSIQKAFENAGQKDKAEPAPPPPDTEEPAPEPVPAPAEEKPKSTNKMIDNAKRLESIRLAKKTREMAQERDELIKEVDEARRIKKLRANAKEDPYAWLKEAGFEGPEEFTVAMVEKGMVTPELQKIQALEEKWEQFEKEKKEFAQQQEVAAKKQLFDQYSSNITKKIDDDSRFEFCRLNNGPQIVLNRMIELVAAADDPHNVDEEALFLQAASELEEFREKEFDKIINLKKAQSKVGSSTRNTPVEASSASRLQSPRTINSKMTASTAPSPPKPGEHGLEAAVKALRSSLGRQKTL